MEQQCSRPEGERFPASVVPVTGLARATANEDLAAPAPDPDSALFETIRHEVKTFLLASSAPVATPVPPPSDVTSAPVHQQGLFSVTKSLGIRPDH